MSQTAYSLLTIRTCQVGEFTPVSTERHTGDRHNPHLTEFLPEAEAPTGLEPSQGSKAQGQGQQKRVERVGDKLLPREEWEKPRPRTASGRDLCCLRDSSGLHRQLGVWVKGPSFRSALILRLSCRACARAVLALELAFKCKGSEDSRSRLPYPVTRSSLQPSGTLPTECASEDYASESSTGSKNNCRDEVAKRIAIYFSCEATTGVPTQLM